MANEVNKEKVKALQLTLDKLEKTYGKGTIMRLGDNAIEAVEVISTGSIGLNAALGIGGLPNALGRRHRRKDMSPRTCGRWIAGAYAERVPPTGEADVG